MIHPTNALWRTISDVSWVHWVFRITHPQPGHPAGVNQYLCSREHTSESSRWLFELPWQMPHIHLEGLVACHVLWPKTRSKSPSSAPDCVSSSSDPHLETLGNYTRHAQVFLSHCRVGRRVSQLCPIKSIVVQLCISDSDFKLESLASICNNMWRRTKKNPTTKTNWL